VAKRIFILDAQQLLNYSMVEVKISKQN